MLVESSEQTTRTLCSAGGNARKNRLPMASERGDHAYITQGGATDG